MQPVLLYTDGDPQNQPDKSSRLNINVNIDWENGTISTEDGNSLVTEYPSIATQGAHIIGKIPLTENNIVLFSVIEGVTKTVSNTQSVSSKFEVGVLSENNSYRVIFRDNVSAGIDMNVNLNTQMQGIYKIGSNNETIIYWVDGRNEMRYLNIDNPQVSVNNNYQLSSTEELEKLSILRSYERSVITLDSVENGGNLKSGVYYIVCSYVDENFNESNTLTPSGPISIVPSVTTNPATSYDGAAANSNTGKSITFSINPADTNFSYIRIYVIAKINSVYSVYDYGYSSLSSSDFSYTISSTDNVASSSLDILIDKVNWIAKTITQLDNRPYIANLQTTEEESIQSWVNNIVVNPYYTTKDLENFSESFHDEKLIYTSRCFQHDEVYALYACPVYKNGKLGKAYHIPGRQVSSIELTGSSGTYTVNENDIIKDSGISDTYIYVDGTSTDTSMGGELSYIDTDTNFFHAFDTSYNPLASSNLGYWENRNESYPDTEEWDIKDSDSIVTGTLRNLKVRHHKMPSFNYLRGSSSPKDVQLLGLVFSNIILPSYLEGKVVGLKFFYAKRTNNNRLVLGQSPFLHDVNLVGSTGLPITDGSGQVSTDWVFSLGSNFQLNVFDAGSYASSASSKKMVRNYSFGRMYPFDTVANNLDTSGANYIKLHTKCTFRVVNLEWSGTVTSDAAGGLAYVNMLSAIIKDWDSNTRLSSYIRRKRNISLTESVPAYDPNSTRNTGANTSLFGFTKKIEKYRGDKCLNIELFNDIESSIYTDDISYTPTRDHTPRDLTIYLTTLYSYKTTIYNSFDNQELVDTNAYHSLTSNAFNNVGDSTSEVYGGDTFVNYHGHRGASDIVFALNFNTDNTISTVGEWRTVHYCPVESVGNINYRYEGTGQYDLYYPKSDVLSVLKIPLLPNGQGNFYGYNSDYSSVNDLVQPVLNSKTITGTTSKFPTRIARGAVDNPESQQDNYLVFLANEYNDTDKSKGEINNITNFQNSLLIQYQNSLRQTATRDRMKTDSSEAYLGAGDIFDYPPKDILLNDSGYSGLHNQFSSVTTQYGVFFVDTNSSNIFLYNGELKPISKEGIEIFCLRNIPLTFETIYKNLIFSLAPAYSSSTSYLVNRVVKYNNSLWRSKQSTTGNTPSENDYWTFLYSYDTFSFEGKDSLFYGYVAGFDNFYKRYLLTKKDLEITSSFSTNFKGEFDSTSFASWTTSHLFIYNGVLYLKRTSGGTDIVEFLSGYYGLPVYFNNSTYFTQNRFTLAYYPEYKGFASWYEYYPDNYFSSQLNFYSQKNTVVSQHNDDLKILIPDNNGPVETIVEPIFNSKEVTKLMSIQWKTKSINPSNDSEDYLSTFDSVQVYDSYQIGKLENITNEVTSRNIEGYWSTNSFRDYTIDNKVSVINPNIWNRPFNSSNIAISKHWSKLKRLVDYWFGARFKYLPVTESSCSIITARLVAPSGSLSYTNDTYLRALINVNPLSGATFNTGDVLKIQANSQTFYAYVQESFAGNEWQLKLYGPINISSNTMAFTSVTVVNKRNKLHLLDLSSVKLKNIR